MKQKMPIQHQFTLLRYLLLASIYNKYKYAQSIPSAIIFRDDVCILISQSGETADTLLALRYCKKVIITTISIIIAIIVITIITITVTIIIGGDDDVVNNITILKIIFYRLEL